MKIIRSRKAKIVASVSVLAGVGFIALQSEPIHEDLAFSSPRIKGVKAEWR